ncbi:TPA: hypothetical protein ACLFZW_005260 [Klebsiella pneumoniae]|nr:hypothetical protein [Klebsiella pneumoniae]
MEELAADGVAHVVFLRRCAPAGLKQIRNWEFSDLCKMKRVTLES